MWIARRSHRLVLLAALLAAHAAMAEEEFPPPGGSGRVVVVLSGMSGPDHYRPVANAIAKLGYDVVLFDSNPMEGTHGEAVKAAIARALAMPHAQPGKVGLVGFSLGGGLALAYGSMLGDQVAVDIAWYPATVGIRDPQALAGRIRTPVVMFAGESDTYRGCCLIAKARDLAAAAKAQNAPFELTTYPRVEHDFVLAGSHYDPNAYADAFQRTTAALQHYLAK